MVSSHNRHCERSEAIQKKNVERPLFLGCFVASLLANTAVCDFIASCFNGASRFSPRSRMLMLAPAKLFDLGGRTALVTGGATGIGRICAEALLAAGARVMIASRKAEACEAAAKELSAIGLCEGFGGTVATEAGVAALAAEALRRTDALHILVNDAGTTWDEPFETFPWKAWERVMSVNVAGLFSLTRDLAPMLAGSASADWPSTIVNIGSVMGSVTQSEHAYSYSASKAAVHHLTRILAAEFAPRHVTVNAIAPGPFPTNMTHFALGDDSGAARGARAVPMGRLGRPEDVAGAILFLAGRGGAYTTGAIVPVDGGISVAAPPPMFGGDE
jgi:NAD(P)-dependent dehydrogenase (short-subunit alcohol dehydrogenase family)